MKSFLAQMLVKVSSLFILLILSSTAQAEISLIKDDEIETALKQLASPVLVSAGFRPETIPIHIIGDRSVNAFTASNMDMYINSGLLITFANDPDATLGVIAHELGHIKAGHVSSQKSHMKNVLKSSILSSIVLGAAAIASSNPDALGAALLGSMHLAERSMLQYSREQESSADLLALQFLDKSHNSAHGLKSAMSYFKKSNFVAAKDINPYTVTHPLPRERLIFIENHLHYSPIKQSNVSGETKQKYIRAIAKLKAFLEPPQKTLTTLKQANLNQTELYAKSIALYKQGDTNQALKIIDQLITGAPKDPYFYELKAQILFETGLINQSIRQYEQALSLLPDSYLIELELAMAQVEAAEESKNTNTANNHLKAATQHLQKLLTKDPEDIIAIREAARAYGKQGNLGMANVYLAESSFLMGDLEEAIKFAKLAKAKFPPSSIYYAKARDLQEAAEIAKRDQ